MDLLDCIRSVGGVAPTHRLLRMGWTSRTLAAAVHAGAIVRVRQGWYASPLESPDHLAAWRVGGRLTCTSGAAELGLATRASKSLHIAVPPTASRLRDPDDMRTSLSADRDIVIHWRPSRPGSAFIESPLTCLIDMVNCEPSEFVVAAVDSALHGGLVSRAAWLRSLAGLTAGSQFLLADVDGNSASILESLGRVRCRRVGLTVRTQAWLAPGIRVDLLIGDRLVVELDGREFHAGAEGFERDRVRDARLGALGFRVLHFSYTQVMFDWPAVEASILAAVARGDHRA
jgi:very-short-patch-repair endonuclease